MSYSSQNKKILIVIVAPSGAGKSTLISKIKIDFPQLKESVSFTTRAMRAGDVDGKTYFFVSKKDFLEKIDNGEFLEWAIVHDNYYGTSKIFIEEQLQQAVAVLLDVDVQGADKIKEVFGDLSKAIFIQPPSINELEKRLQRRQTDTPEVIRKRIENAKKELLRSCDYDYSIVNDDLERAYTELRGIIQKLLDL